MCDKFSKNLYKNLFNPLESDLRFSIKGKRFEAGADLNVKCAPETGLIFFFLIIYFIYIKNPHLINRQK
jgi:hypothetical protein